MPSWVVRRPCVVVAVAILVACIAAVSGLPRVQAEPTPVPGCSFTQGVTTCTTTTEEQTTATHVAVSGCLYGPTGQPGRRERTFLDTYLVSTTTVTQQHGLAGEVFDTQVSTMRTLVDSQLVSDVCLPA